MIPTTLLSELREKAKAAHPGPFDIWKAKTQSDGGYDWAVTTKVLGENRCLYECINVIGEGLRVNAAANAAFIAAANPSTILALLDEIERLRAGQRTPGTEERCARCNMGAPFNVCGDQYPSKCPLRAQPKEMKK